MVATTSVTVTPACGGSAMSCCSCCSGSSSKSWGAGSSSRSGLKGLQQRCSAAAAGKAAAVAAGATQQKRNRSVVVRGGPAGGRRPGEVCGSTSPQAAAQTPGGDCEELLLRRVQSFANHQPHTTAAAAAASFLTAAAAASLDVPDGTIERAEMQKEGVDLTPELLCGSALHHHPLTAESAPMWCRSSGSSGKLQQAFVVGTSCPDFMLFFPRSPVETFNTKGSSEKKAFLAVVPANGYDSSTCGSACFSTDDEKGSSNSSREERDLSTGCSATKTAVNPEAKSLMSAKNMGETHCATAPSSLKKRLQEGERSTTEMTLASTYGKGCPEAAAASQAATVAVAAGGGSNPFTLQPSQPIADIQTKTDEKDERDWLLSSAPPDDPHITAGSDVLVLQGPADAEATREAFGFPSCDTIAKEDTTRTATPAAKSAAAGSAAAADSAAATDSAAVAAGSAGAELAASTAGEGLGEAREGAASIERAGEAQAVETEVEVVEVLGGSSAQQAAEVEMNARVNCDATAAAAAARICKEVDAAVIFPSPQPPSLPQLLQLPDVYEAAISALRVLPERYIQRIRQLDALEALFPRVYVHCSYLARVRHVYVFSRDLILNQRETLLQQLQEERSHRRSSSSKVHTLMPQDPQQQHMEDGRMEEEEEDSSSSWNADLEQHKALHAVAGLFMEIKAVQTRVGPTLLAGAAQLADILQLAEQEEKERSGKHSERGSINSTSDGKWSYRDVRVEYDHVNDVIHSSYFSTKGCSRVDISEEGVDSLNGFDNHTRREKGSSSCDRDSNDRHGLGSNSNERREDVHERDSNSSSGAGTFYIGHCCKGVQMLVDNFLHSFFSCRVAAELQREHFLLAVQSGDCGAILSSCLPMEQLIFQAALDVQELALHHLGIAAPVEVWVGEAGKADQQLRAFLLAASIREGPAAVAWSACSSPTTPCRPVKEQGLLCSAAACGVAATKTQVEEKNSAAAAALWCPAASREQQEPPQLGVGNCNSVKEERRGNEEGRGNKEGRRDAVAAADQGSSPCRTCLSSSFAAAVASPRWRARSGRDTQYNAFSRNSSRSRSNSLLPGTVRFPCFASYAYSGIFELLKNSMRASIEAWRLNRYTRSNNGGNNCRSNDSSSSSNDCNSRNGCSSRNACNSSNSLDSERPHRNSNNDSEEQQRWRLLSVKRSRKLKKLPGRVRLQRRCFDSAATTRFRVTMACNEDLAAAADQERAARSRNKEENQLLVEDHVRNQGDSSSQTKDEDMCCEVVQLEEGVLPPIKVLLLFVDDSLIIRIEDQGEGLRQKELQNVWSFAYSTAAGKGLLQRLAAAGDDSEDEKNKSTAAESRRRHSRSAATAVPPLAGCGVGLPMSRVHAQSLGGDIFLESAEGIGTCAYMCLSNLQGFRDRLYEQHRSRQERNL